MYFAQKSDLTSAEGGAEGNIFQDCHMTAYRNSHQSV